jgi:hypothetical protein
MSMSYSTYYQLWVNVDQIRKKVLNVKLKEIAHVEDQDQDASNLLGKMSHSKIAKKWEETEVKLWKDQEINGEAWLVNKPHVSPW